MLTELKNGIENAVRSYCEESLHRDIAIQALCRPGFALHPDTSCKAGLFTLEIYRAIAGECNSTALLAATAVELIKESGDMFDDVADGEVDTTFGITVPEEIALAITLLSSGVAVAHEAASSLKKGNLAVQAVLQIQINSIAACAGQFLDAYLQKSNQATTEDSLKMTSLKSGSIGKLVGEFSASVASDDRETIHLFGEFGFNLFTYLQLIDDLKDAVPADSHSLDFLQKKKTLPMVFFHNSFSDTKSINESDIIVKRCERSSSEFRETFESSGSRSFCAIVAEVYLNRAKANLVDLYGKLAKVESLERLVGSFEINTQEIPLAS